MEVSGMLAAITANNGPVWGIIGTLLGSLMANSNSRKMAYDKQRHEDWTRFHDKKVTLYGEFCALAVDLTQVLYAVCRTRKSTQDDLIKALTRQNDICKNFTTLVSSITLLGGKKVNTGVGDVYKAYNELSDAMENGNLNLQDAKEKDFHKALADAREAMREELGLMP